MRSGSVACFVQIEIGRSRLPGNFLEIGNEFPALRMNARTHFTGLIPEHDVDRVHPIAYRRVAARDVQFQFELAPRSKEDTNKLVVGPGRSRARFSGGIAIERDRERSSVCFPISVNKWLGYLFEALTHFLCVGVAEKDLPEHMNASIEKLGNDSRHGIDVEVERPADALLRYEAQAGIRVCFRPGVIGAPRFRV